MAVQRADVQRCAGGPQSVTGTGNTVTGNQVPGQSGSGNGNYNAFGQMNGNNNTNNQQA